MSALSCYFCGRPLDGDGICMCEKAILDRQNNDMISELKDEMESLVHEVGVLRRRNIDLAQHVVRLTNALNAVEDRHHTDTEWCAESKEVLG